MAGCRCVTTKCACSIFWASAPSCSSAPIAGKRYSRSTSIFPPLPGGDLPGLRTGAARVVERERRNAEIPAPLSAQRVCPKRRGRAECRNPSAGGSPDAGIFYVPAGAGTERSRLSPAGAWLIPLQAIQKIPAATARLSEDARPRMGEREQVITGGPAVRCSTFCSEPSSRMTGRASHTQTPKGGRARLRTCQPDGSRLLWPSAETRQNWSARRASRTASPCWRARRLADTGRPRLRAGTVHRASGIQSAENRTHVAWVPAARRAPPPAGREGTAPASGVAAGRARQSPAGFLFQRTIQKPPPHSAAQRHSAPGQSFHQRLAEAARRRSGQ